jgi:hypothetical protein
MLAALAVPAATAIALLRIQRAAVFLSSRGEDVHLSMALGVFAIGLASIVLLFGALRFGRVGTRRSRVPVAET